jgi:hypothetical protein
VSRKVIVLPEAEKQLKIRAAWWRENRTDVPEQVKKGFEELKTQLAETPWIGVRIGPRKTSTFLASSSSTPSTSAVCCESCSSSTLTTPCASTATSSSPSPSPTTRTTRARRASTTAFIGKTKVAVVIDVGIGDSTEPGIVDTEYPTLLDTPAHRPSALGSSALRAGPHGASAQPSSVR